jgi:hypothetical protein
MPAVFAADGGLGGHLHLEGDLAPFALLLRAAEIVQGGRY